MNKWRDHSREIDKDIIAAFDPMDVCVNVMSTLPHANVHMQVCVHDVWVGITNQLCFSRFFKVISHLRHWWLMTFAEIRQTLYSPPSPKLSGEHRGNIYMAGWAFLINHSLSSHSADQGAVFQWPSPAKVQHFYPNTTPCVLCTCEFVKYSCESIKSTPNEN